MTIEHRRVDGQLFNVEVRKGPTGFTWVVIVTHVKTKKKKRISHISGESHNESFVQSFIRSILEEIERKK